MTDTTIDLAQTLVKCRALKKRIQDAGYQSADASFTVGNRGDEISLYLTHKPIEADGDDWRAMRSKFFYGRARADEVRRIFEEADAYVANLPQPAERGHAALAQHLAKTAELAEMFGLRDRDAEPWDAMAKFLREMSQRVADRGLPKPEDFPQTPVAASVTAGGE